MGNLGKGPAVTIPVGFPDSADSLKLFTGWIKGTSCFRCQVS